MKAGHRLSIRVYRNLPDAAFPGHPRPALAASLTRVLGQRRADGVLGGGGDGDADHALTATFRYFVGFHSRVSRCASAI